LNLGDWETKPRGGDRGDQAGVFQVADPGRLGDLFCCHVGVLGDGDRLPVTLGCSGPHGAELGSLRPGRGNLDAAVGPDCSEQERRCCVGAGASSDELDSSLSFLSHVKLLIIILLWDLANFSQMNGT